MSDVAVDTRYKLHGVALTPHQRDVVLRAALRAKKTAVETQRPNFVLFGFEGDKIVFFEAHDMRHELNPNN